MIDMLVQIVSSSILSASLPKLCHAGVDILHLFPYIQSMLSAKDKTEIADHVDDISSCSLIFPSVTACIPSSISLQEGYSHNDLLLGAVESSDIKSAQQRDKSPIYVQTPCQSLQVCLENKRIRRQLYADSDHNTGELSRSTPSPSQSSETPTEEIAVSNKSLLSIVEGVEDTADVDNLVGMALLYQHMFNKRTSPYELNDFEDGELNNFTIELEKLDRVYYVYHFDDRVASREYELLARMDYKGTKVFIQLSASCDYNGFDCQGTGEIYITKKPNIFLKSVVDDSNKPKKIWQSLVADGYNVCEPTEFDLSPPGLWQNVPMLKFLTHMAVYQHRKKLSFYPEVLPPLLRHNLDEFIQVRATKDHHDS